MNSNYFRKLMVKFIPQAFKYKVARILGNTLFKLMTIGHFNVLDKKLLWLFIKLQDFDKAEKIISKHANELYYLRFLEKVERCKAFGKFSEERRLDYNQKDFKRILNINQNLIKRFPEDFHLHHSMGKNYASNGDQERARFHFFESLKLQRKDKLAQGKTGLIFIAGGHRSGTGFTERSLKEGLNIKDNVRFLIRNFDEYFPKYGIVELPTYLGTSHCTPMPDGVMGTHAGAIGANLKTLPLITDKILVIVRDIRQSIVSKVEYSEYLRLTGNITALLQYQYPNGFFHWPINKKIDWQIDNYYTPADIEWIKGWLIADEDPEFPCKIHFSRFEVLARDPKRYFQEILSFYDLPEDKFTFPQKPEFNPKTHLRKGSTDEWKDVLSEKQVQKINNLILDEWFERFNWPKI